MNQILKAKKRGGAGRGQGRKKGSRSKETILRDQSMQALQQYIFKIAPKLVEAQVVEGVGYYRMMVLSRVAGKVVYTRVTDRKEFDRLISEGKAGEDYVIMAAEDPNHKASDAVLNRAYGRPTESVELSNKDGQPFVIMIDK